MKLTFFGHSCFLIESNSGFKAVIDPFLKENPVAPVQPEHLKGITHVFITHGHGDHMADALGIAKANGSIVIANYEICKAFEPFHVETHPMHIGGRMIFDFGRVKMTPALHGSGIEVQGNMVYGGNPCGFVIELDGKKMYHAGDTGLTMDMQLLADELIDVAILPIGGNFTMDIEDALRAVDFIQPKKVIPMHYNTFPLIRANPRTFAEKCPVEVVVLEPGDCFTVE